MACRSNALIADAGHSLSDLFSDFITLWSVRIARLPPDDDHPYGHYKFEAIGSLFLSLTLLATGISVGIVANKQLLQLLATQRANHAAAAVAAAAAFGSVSVATAIPIPIPLPTPMTLVMAGISIASKEWLYRITRKVGEKLNSPVVIANAGHHRSDAYSSVLALLSIVWAMTGFAAADAAAGMLVAGMICMTGGDILGESIQQLSDSANEELQDKANDILTTMVDDDGDILQSTSIRARQVGSSAFVDVILETPSELSTTATRAVEERVKHNLVSQLYGGSGGSGGSASSSGSMITATVHAKPNLVGCPSLLEKTRQEHEDNYNNYNNHRNMNANSSGAMEATTTTSPNNNNNNNNSNNSNNNVNSISASQIEFLTRQQALLMYPKIDSISGVTVHYYSTQREAVTVDVNIVVGNNNSNSNNDNDNDSDSKPLSLEQVHQVAKELQELLQDLDEIDHANIYLDLLGKNNDNNNNNNNGNNENDDIVPDMPAEALATITNSNSNSNGNGNGNNMNSNSNSNSNTTTTTTRTTTTPSTLAP